MNATAYAPEPARFPDNEAAGAGGFAEAPAAFDRDPAAAASAAVVSAIALMASDGIKQLLACDPGQQPPFTANADVFDRRRCAYLAAKAAVNDPNKPDGNESATLLDAALETAEVLLLATPAALPWQAWIKFEILKEAIVDGLRHGQGSAPRVLMALASFEHDLCRFDLVDGDRI